MSGTILSRRIAILENAVSNGELELKPELESLKAVAQGLIDKSVSLEQLLKLGDDSFEAVVKELAEKKEIALLMNLSRAELGKVKRKIIKKAIHQLKSNGVQIPEAIVERKITIPSRVVKEWIMASPVMLMSGAQLIYYYASGTMGSNFMIIHLNSREGIKETKIFHLNESYARDMISDARISSEIPVPAIEISKEHFFWRIQRAESVTISQEPKAELHSFLEKFLVKIPEAIEAEHPVFKEIDVEKVKSISVYGFKIDQLLEHSFFRRWEFNKEIIDACEEELKEVALSPIQISESLKMERIEKVFEKYAEEGVMKSLEEIRFCLMENAYLLKLRGEDEFAELALKLAISLENKNESLEFFKKILLRSFPDAWKVLGKKGEGLIIPGI